ncbi:MAG: mannonate dehydratase [Anaerolineae bacterium]|nr:mannonate dehydratase [Anaerolineae bacterium]
MKVGLRSDNGAEERLLFAQQIGADGASIWASACPGYEERCYLTVENVRDMRERLARYDLELTGIGLGGKCLKHQLLGLPGRDAEIENVGRTIRSIGQVYAGGSPAPVVIIDQRTTYWAPRGPHWHPGYERLPAGRGGAYLTTFDAGRIRGELDDRPAGEVSLEEVWARIAYFYERIVPVAEEARVRLATHPDDPPMACYRGVHHALVGLEGLTRLVELVPSPYNGLLLCLGCLQEAGEDVPAVIRALGARQKIFYVHLRNVMGKVPRYTEVFPDEGDGDMAANLAALQEVGYTGYLVPDHHFGFAGDSDWAQASRAWQVGYIRGLMQGLGIERG